MKKRNLLTKGIYLINKKYKKNEFYHFIEEPSNSLIIPILKNKKFILVKQKREPINKINYEFPMGWIDKGENSISTAKRELLEETGYKSIIKPKKIMVFYPDPGRNRRKMYCFYTDKIEKISKPEKNLKIFVCSGKKIFELIKKQEFNNSSHIAAFYYFFIKNKIKF